jgi:hypothetical protein
MNPLSLLTKGSTIRGLKERPGPYKLLDKSGLPNFSGPKSPAPTTSHPEPENRSSGSQPALFEGPQPQSAAEAPAQAPVELSVARRGAAVPPGVVGGGVTPPEPAAATAAPQDKPSKPRLWSRLAGRLAEWARQWMPWRKERPFQKAAVQTELALDKVKVIRNDLSEDDLEVVAIDKKAGEEGRETGPERGS